MNKSLRTKVLYGLKMNNILKFQQKKSQYVLKVVKFILKQIIIDERDIHCDLYKDIRK